MTDSKDYETQAVMALLEAAQAEMIGIAFLPDGDGGWDLYYLDLTEWPPIRAEMLAGTELASAYDLETAARAALKPIRALIQEKDRKGDDG